MGDISYELSLKLAPFVSVSLERNGTATAIIHVDLDPRHAHLTISLLSMGIDTAFVADASAATYVAQVFALINDYDATAPAAAAAVASTKRSFTIALSSDPSVKDVGVLGADPDSADDNGLQAKKSTGGEGSSISSNEGGGNGDDPVPIDVVVRKARIPIPPGSGQSSVMVNVVVIIITFVAGVIVGQLLS